jgi:putative FmdB family regulatory protein
MEPRMPIYEYECAKCHKVHEISQKMSDKPLTKCPECKGRLQKLISMSGFALKGSGFYTTDYKRAGAGTCAPTGQPGGGCGRGAGAACASGAMKRP